VSVRFLVGVVGFFAVATFASAQDKLKLEPKFDAAKPFYQKVSTVVSQTVKVQNGADMSLKHSQTFMFKWAPDKQEGDKWNVKLSIEGVILEVEINGNAIKYDSMVETPAANQNAGLAEFFKNLIGTEFTITFKKGGEVEKVSGKEDFLRKLGVANPQMEAMLKKILSDEALKEMSDPLAGIAPPVDKDGKPTEKAVSESWEKSATLPLGPIGSYDRKVKYTFKGKDPTKAEVDLIEADVNITYKAPAGEDGLLFRIKSGNLAVDPSKKTTSVYKFNRVTGRLDMAELKVNLTGKLTVTINNTDTEVEVYQEQKTTMETKDTSYITPKK
jgi:hypothetical protein